jgi:nitrous oxidase accessory protein NosD
MTARRDGCFGAGILAIETCLEVVALEIVRETGVDAKEIGRVKSELRAAIAVLRAAEKAVISPPDYSCENEYLFHAEKKNVKLARAILNARRVHEKGKKK